MYKKLIFTIILILGLISCAQKSFKLKIDSYEYVITTNNINDTFKAIIDNEIYDMTPLIYASYSGNLPLAKFSVINGADINLKDENGTTALIMATTNGNLEIIKYLSDERGLEINAQDDNEKTALMYAAMSGNLEIVKYLVEERRVDMNVKDSQGHNAFMYAIMEGHLEVVKYLIENGTNINDRNRYNSTALMLASLNGKFEVAKYLIEKKANIYIRAESGRNALDLGKLYVDRLFGVDEE